MNEVYAKHVGDDRPRARRSRSRRCPSGALVEIEAIAHRLIPPRACIASSRTTSARSGSTPTSSAAPCATSCSGSSRRTRTSSCSASITTQLRARSSRTAASRISRSRASASASASGRATPSCASSRRSGIEFAPPRRERSTGPGRHDFEIVVDADGVGRGRPAPPRLHVNAIARRLDDGELVDPFDGQEDLDDRVLRTVSPLSFAEDPLRIVRGLRFVSQFDLAPDERRCGRCRRGCEHPPRLGASGSAAACGADGMGELSKLLLGARPAKALRLARDTGVLVALIPEFAPAIDYEQSSARQDRPLDEHIFAVVQSAADAGASLAVRLGALFHDLGKPEADETGADHAELGRADRRRRARALSLSRRASGGTSSTSSARTRFRWTTSTSCSREGSCARTASSSRATWSRTSSPTSRRSTCRRRRSKRPSACAR